MARQIRRRRARTLYIGEWIRVLGRKQVEIMRLTGINEGYLSQLVNRERINPSADILATIAEALGIDVQALYRPPPSRAAIDEIGSLDRAQLAQLAELLAKMTRQ